jgi:hypothetical protein
MDDKMTLIYATLGMAATLYAVALETPIGKWLTHERTWITVAAGNGLVLVALFFLLDTAAWWRCLAAFAVAGAPVIVRSLINDWRRNR